MIKKYLTYIKESKDPFKEYEDYSLDYIDVPIFINVDILVKQYGFSQALKQIKNILIGKYIRSYVFTKEEEYAMVCKVDGIRIKKIKKLYNDRYIFSHIKTDNRWYGLMNDNLMDIDKYVDILKKLIGHQINFHSLEIKDDRSFIEGFELDDVFLNPKNSKIYFVNVNGDKMSVDINSPITKYKKRLFTPEDPYGEEDWDDINESKNKIEFTIKEIIKLLRGVKMNNISDVINALNNTFKENKLYLFDKKENKYLISGSKSYFYFIPEPYVNKTLHINFDDGGEIKAVHIKEKDFDNFVISNYKRINNELDPYGEEDWDEMNESSIEKEECVDLRDVVRNPKLLLNKLVRFYTYALDNRTEIMITGVIKNLTVADGKVKATISNGNEYYLFYSRDSIFIIDDPIREREREREIEKIRLKYLDIDPYGEEDWEEMSENMTYNKDIKYKIINSLSSQEFKDISLNELNDKFTGWIAMSPSLKEYLMHIIRWTNKKSFLYDSYYYQNVLNICGREDSYGGLIGNENIDKIEFYYNRKYSELDPYGEEDWENENKIYENFFDNSFDILIENLSDYNLIMQKLEDRGYIWQNNKLPTSLCYFNGRPNYILHASTNKILTYYNNPLSIDVILTVDEFLKIENKKFRKIENPEIDPYGEEDWGYEEIKENINRLDLDPYGEENWNDYPVNEIKDELTRELRYFNGKMISFSKSSYRNSHKNNLVVFNSSVFIDGNDVFGGCDIDITEDFKKIKEISKKFNDVDISIYSERFGNVGDYVWGTKRGLNNIINYDENLLRKHD